MINRIHHWILVVCLLLVGSLVQHQPIALGQTFSNQHFFVDPSGDDGNDGHTPTTPFATIQHALEAAQPGDTIHLAPTTFDQNVVTVRDGREDAPITITGTSESIINGNDGERIFQVFHSYITLEGFTIDGRRSDNDENSRDGYWNKLLYAEGREPQKGVIGLRLLNMNFRNAGGECVRLRYFVQYSEIAYSTFKNCGIYDFRLDGGGKVGEGIYVGTSSEQWAENPTNEPDRTAYNWIHHNQFETHGNECVEMKEGTHDNIVEHNICTQQQDDDSAGIGSRGDNTIRYNEIYENEGAGIRLGGHEVNGVPYGSVNYVYGNSIYDNQKGGIKVEVAQQGIICGNTLMHNESGQITGQFSMTLDSELACEASFIQSQPKNPYP
ncbi:MAG: DUF1565 domain-containing protein [Anaerolineae bacterium]|nr:DUF1565 domain-containing protein [Anaerolineae bacterium]